jgi:glycosyl transferase family 25
MRAFIINLDSATDRWAWTQAVFSRTQLVLCRVPAVNGKTLTFPSEHYSERLYRWFHGRTSNPRELACYLSHLKALDAFLATGEKHGLIAEDDLVLRPGFEGTLEAAMQYARHWNILRVATLGRGHPVKLARLSPEHFLCVNFGRLKGCGAYVVDRIAARALRSHLLPMRLPYDHAIDREWFLGLRAVCILPFPASQTETDFLSSVQPGIYPKLSETRRWLTTYPYQALNEMTRWIFRAFQYVRFKLARIFRSAEGDVRAIRKQSEIESTSRRFPR